MPAAREFLLISDLFVSFQGEGKYLGHPSIFVRTSGCNLRCRWGETLCDTPYTSWHPEHRRLSVASVVARVAELRAAHPHVHHVILTGGEPLVQKHLGVLAEQLHAAGCFLTVETNGTLARPLPVDFVSLSPKLSSATPVGTSHAAKHERVRRNLPALRAWIAAYDYQLKFVVNTPADEAEILELLEALAVPIPAEHVYLMPQGVVFEQLAEHGRLCLAMCLRHGWKYTPRGHIEIFGNERGR